MKRIVSLTAALVLTIAPPVVSLVAPQLLLAQPDTLWTRTYGGTDVDVGYSVAQTADGGFIVSGYTSSFGTGETDVYLIRTNSNGDTLWTKTYGGGGQEEGHSVAQTTDGGFIVTGVTRSFGAGGWDVYLIRTDSNGETRWTKTYGGDGNDGGHSVVQTADGGFIVTGHAHSSSTGDDVYLIRTNSNGDTLWTKTYGGGGQEEGHSVAQTADGGFIVAGYTSSGAGGFDVNLIRTDSNGETLWTKTYGGTEGDIGYSVAQTADGGYIVAGFTHSFGAGESDAYLIRTSSNGDTLWTETYGGGSHDEGRSVVQTADGGFIVSGYTSSFGTGETDVYLIRTNSNGDTLWTETYGGIFGEIGFSLAQTSDGGFIVAGYTRSFGAGSYDVWLLKLEGFPYFQLDPYQDRVPRGGTLDFEGIYMNFADTLIKSEVVFEAYLPGGTAPQKVFSDTKNIYPGIDTLYYALSVPIAAPKKSGYLIKGKIIVPPGSGEVVSEDSFEFEVKPAMESLPFRFDWSE